MRLEILLHDSAQPLRNSLDLVSWGNKFLISFLWGGKKPQQNTSSETIATPLSKSLQFLSLQYFGQQAAGRQQCPAACCTRQNYTGTRTKWGQLRRSHWHLVAVLQWYFHFSSDYITWEVECICWSCTELGNTFISGGCAGRTQRWRHKWNCTFSPASPSWGSCPMAAAAGKHLACSCLHSQPHSCATLHSLPAPGELPKATLPLADAAPLLMWELKHSSAKTRKRKWARNHAGLKTLKHLFTLQILQNSELIIPRKRCRIPSEGLAHENNVEGALVPNTANTCLLLELVPYFPGLENNNRGSDVPPQQVHFDTSQLQLCPPWKGTGTYKWLIIACWQWKQQLLSLE